MAANTPSDRWSLLLQQRKLYEVDVAEALLSEEREERDERLRLVRVCQPMAVKSLQAVSVFDPEDYEE